MRANEQAVFCTLRTRLVAEVFSGGQCVATQHAFNEACIDRGPAVNFLQLDAYIDGSYVTTIQVHCLPIHLHITISPNLFLTMPHSCWRTQVDLHKQRATQGS